MKYKLTKEAIEELKAMEFADTPMLYYWGDYGRKISKSLSLQPIAEKLPKPTIKTVEDFKALKGWEHQWQYNSPSVWFKPNITLCKTLEEVSKAKIRQIDMPENEYLVKDCIEQETKEPISIADYQAHKDREFEAKVREIIKKVLKEEVEE